MEYLALIGISILPVIIICYYIYNKDQNKEPIKLLIKLFCSGFLSVILTLIVSAFMQFIPIFKLDVELNAFERIINVFVGIALVEEFFKWIMAYKIGFNNKEFDELYDMIIYCVFVALGFALIENLLYVLSSGIAVGIARALLSVPSHACDGIFMGINLGLAKYYLVNDDKKKYRMYMILSLLLPIATHGIYDYCVLSNYSFLYIVAITFTIVIYIISYVKIKKISKENPKLFAVKFCPHCGIKLETPFCPQCGYKKE